MGFTPCAEQALQQSKNANDLLEALVKQREGSALEALRLLRVNVDQLIPELRALVDHPRRPVRCPSAQEIVQIARTEADEMGHKQVATGHLLIAVLHLPSAAEQVLQEQGADIQALRRSMKKIKATKPISAGRR